jgi:Uma2 family endonuclease
MASTTSITAEEYFRIYFPEREAELVHGVLKERPMPDWFHGFIQARLSHLISIALAKQTVFSVVTKLRMRPAEDLVRIPDLCILDYFPDPDTAPTRPPLLAVEIGSKDDRESDLLERFNEYRVWGVPDIWLIDPRAKRLALYGASGLVQVERLELAQFGLSLKIEDLLPPTR